jgi:hypothetical protein
MNKIEGLVAIVHATGGVSWTIDAEGTKREYLDAAATPATYDADGVELTPRIEADPATLYEEVAVDDLRTHKWLTARYAAEEWAALRAKRDELLAACDWVVVKAQEAGEDVPAAWVTYRTALRNLPAATSDASDPTWPSAP